ncbi:ras-associated and pleckstrin homology domains-containing protein 1 isoform X2 [Spodoptera frugiperda]|nr:ras-associated and pleckstrin homology domains-containing protein 1 isoform X2 [Spodoptera frugiperda]
MSNGALPQWKRELLQRRAAARSRPAQPPPQPPPPPPPPPHDEEDEELRYGPGIVKRLQSRYLSLALRDAPRRRPSVLRRATSLEHLLDDRPPPAPAPRNNLRPPRPASMAVPPAPLIPSTRRDSVKRARSVDALSRLDSREEPRAPSPSPPPPLAPRPPAQPRTARPPRRPTPLLRETERPPPDVVRSTLRKFESAPTRRAPPAVRISAVLRGLEGPRTSTPEPRESSDAPLSPRTPSPLPATEAMSPVPVPVANNEDTENALPPSGSRPVSRAALDGIARAGSTVRYAFEVPRAASHLPPLAATNQVLVGRARRVGVIRPMPARATDSATDESVEDIDEKSTERTTRLVSPSPPPPADSEQPPGRTERREPPPAALVEPIPRPPPESFRSSTPPAPSFIERSPSPETKPKLPETITPQLINGHLEAEGAPENKVTTSRIGAAGIERAWSGSADKKSPEKAAAGGGAAWARGSPAQARRGRGPPPASTSVVFNFSNRKEVPDYIENDGIILRANRRNRIKPGEPGVVVLRPDALLRSDSESDTEPDGADGSPPSPCSVRFVNDNVLINGRSSMPTRPNKDRISKLKLQFDDSLTRTFEYPSETSLSEEGAAEAAPGTPQLAEPPLHAPLAANTHITSAALSRYRPHKTRGAAFTLGVTPPDAAGAAGAAEMAEVRSEARSEAEGEGDGDREGEGDARPCGADLARSWSEARTHHTDLLF